MSIGKTIKVAGPLVIGEDIPGARLYDSVKVGKDELLGEIIEIRGNKSSIQVYEDTSGMGIGEPIVSMNEPLSIELGPGLLGTIMDGIGRDLEYLSKHSGSYLDRGAVLITLDKDKRWDFIPLKEVGSLVKEYDVLGYVMENNIKHYIRVPKGMLGTVSDIKAKNVSTYESIAKIDGKEVGMVTKWPIRENRPFAKKLIASKPLITGQRVIDTFFPVVKGGAACVPGPFGSGKTVVQHQLAKWSNSDVVVYIGCGERGNEMTDVLNEFPEIIDPKTEKSLMDKTVLIANTSNMPVAAREASIYTGMSIAEYYRDMGLDVSLMADSTSRWAEALREMSGRLEEMPGDEGYPAYLGSRIAHVYERAGIVKPIGEDIGEGSVTMIGAVSPAGGDLSEPVTQATLRVAKVFWALDASLAYARHFPAINWLESYSLYNDKIDNYLKKNYDRNFIKYRNEAMQLLQSEAKLQEVVQLVGKDSLSDNDLLRLQTAKMIREDFLQQNAFQKEDTFTDLDKQIKMLRNILEYYHLAKEAIIHDHVYIADIENMECVYELSRMKYRDTYDEVYEKMKQEFEDLRKGGNYERL